MARMLQIDSPYFSQEIGITEQEERDNSDDNNGDGKSKVVRLEVAEVENRREIRESAEKAAAPGCWSGEAALSCQPAPRKTTHQQTRWGIGGNPRLTPKSVMLLFTMQYLAICYSHYS